MSFNVGISKTKFVKVNDVVTKHSKGSGNMTFAEGVTSTLASVFENGSIVKDENGDPIKKRVYSSWNLKFVGNALEASKGLDNGAYIDIDEGWLVKREWTDERNNKRDYIEITISDFSLSEFSSQNLSGDGDDVAFTELPVDESFEHPFVNQGVQTTNSP